jgi:hypothetical protein
VEKCIWILEKKFNCRRFGYLNTDHFKTPASVVEKLKQVRLPVLISVAGKNSMYNHVVIIWRDMIIDYESRHVSSLCSKCGTNLWAQKCISEDCPWMCSFAFSEDEILCRR